MADSSNPIRWMRIQARPGSLAEARHYRQLAQPEGGWVEPAAIADGIPEEPAARLHRVFCDLAVAGAAVEAIPRDGFARVEDKNLASVVWETAAGRCGGAATSSPRPGWWKVAGH